MRKAIDIIRGEHRALAAVLSGLSDFTEGVARGRFDPDFDLLAAMIRYVTEVPEKVHHPKEDDFLFAMLRQRDPGSAALLDDLQQEHRAGPGRTVALTDVLERYRIAGEPMLPAFRAAVKDYVDDQWQHMSKEEKEVLPVARAVLTDQDWAAIDAAFAANENPWEGPAGAFRQLFTQIVTIAPASIGVGDPGRPPHGH